MLTEIYVGNENDPSYNSSLLEISNEKDLLIQQIKMLFDTSNGEIIGEPNFGIGLESMLFDFELNEKQLKRRIMDQINAYCDTENFTINIEIKFFKGSVRDAAQIDIFINGSKSMGVFIK